MNTVRFIYLERYWENEDVFLFRVFIYEIMWGSFTGPHMQGCVLEHKFLIIA